MKNEDSVKSYKEFVFEICFSHIQHGRQLMTTGYNRHLITLSQKSLDSG
ncbi:MAG: hypothetical protein IKH16_11265 [Selenomonadaceae bacterium]|nr:hypothetical protein [Selenomonadaceae bacterium]